MRKPEILKAIKTGDRLVYDPDARKSYSRKDARIVKVLEYVDDGTPWEDLHGKVKESFRNRRRTFDVEARTYVWVTDKPSWLVVEVEVEDEVEDYNYSSNPGTHHLAESAHLVGSVESRRDADEVEYGRYVETEEQRDEWSEYLEREYPPRVSLRVGHKGPRMEIGFPWRTEEADGIVERLRSIPGKPVPVDGSVRTSTVTVEQVLLAVRHQDPSEKYLSPQTVESVLAYYDSGHGVVRIQVTDPVSVMRIADALAPSGVGAK